MLKKKKANNVMQCRGVGRTFKRGGVVSEAICDHVAHVVVIFRIVTEKHIILAMILVKGNVLQLHLVFSNLSVILVNS